MRRAIMKGGRRHPDAPGFVLLLCGACKPAHPRQVHFHPDYARHPCLRPFQPLFSISALSDRCQSGGGAHALANERVVADRQYAGGFSID